MNSIVNSLPSIEACLPHQGAMRLVHRLVAADDVHAVTEVDVPADGLFAGDGGTPAWVGLEYMAQTIAAWSGVRAWRAHRPPRLGYLLGSRRFVAAIPQFPAGATLRVEAVCEMVAANGLGQFACRVLLDGQAVASALVSVFEPGDGVEEPA